MEETKTLENNKINQFILRIDLSEDSFVDLKQVAEKLKGMFNSFKTELHVNYNINVPKKEFKKEDYIKYLLGTPPATCVQLESFEKSIIITTINYKDNSAYKAILSRIIEVIQEEYSDKCISARRIGMRYINNFPCAKIADISKILNISEARAIKEIAGKNQLARAMLVHEYQMEDNMVRIQLGIPNRFYPSIIRNYDIVLDIDVYSTGLQSIDLWNEKIRSFNHQAYDHFVNYVKETYRQGMK